MTSDSSDARARVVGVDGCRAGWVVAERDAVRVVPSLGLLVADATIGVIGVDMPVGLPSRWGRRADDEARALLRSRSSTIFSTPPRSLLEAATYAEANRCSWSTFGQGLPKQTYNLFARIREVDALFDAARPDRLVEIHPECAFVTMADRSLSSKHTGAGRSERRRLLRREFGPIVDTVPIGARIDDVFDAYAVLWSCERFAGGRHVVLGRDASTGRVDHDDRGRPMRIVR